MQTVIYFQWCEARFLGEGIPCPGQIVTLSKGRSLMFALAGMNAVGKLARFEDDGSGNLISVVEEVQEE